MLTGFHATIFVYGQTGSGKTFTMEGYKYVKGPKEVLQPRFDRNTATLNTQPEQLHAIDQAALNSSLGEEGIIPRAIRNLFSQIEAKRAESAGKCRISVKVQYI